jgi:integrase
MLYKRGKRGVYYYDFFHRGNRYCACTGVTSSDSAKRIERNKRNEVEDSVAGIAKPKRIPIFPLAAETYLSRKKGKWAPRTYIVESTNVRHLQSQLGNVLLNEITADHVIEYRDQRIGEGAAPKTTSLEIATLRACMRNFDLDAHWRAIAKHFTFSKSNKVGRCLSLMDQQTLLDSCRQSRSRSIYIAVVLALRGGLRLDEIRYLRWVNVDLQRQTITVAKSKTENGEGRVLDMGELLHPVLTTWAAQFPDRKPAHFLLPSEKYGQGGKVYSLDVTRPLACIKYAWTEARQRAGLPGIRFHDLRHTAITNLLESGVSFPIVGEIAGWSVSSTVRMAKVYGHIGQNARKEATAKRDQFLREGALQQSRQISQQTEGGVTTTVQ